MDLEGYQFDFGAQLPNGTTYIAARYPDTNAESPNHTAVLVINSDDEFSDGGVIHRKTSAMCLNGAGDGVIMVNDQGQALELGPNMSRRVDVRGETDQDGMAVRSLSVIGGTVFAGAMDRFVYERQAETSWAEVSDPVMRGEAGTVAGVLAIAGTSAEEVYAFGYNGVMHSRIGGVWSEISSITNLGLRTAVFSGDRFIVGGQMGVLIEGRGNDWRIIEQDHTEGDFIGSATVGDRCYLATDTDVYELLPDRTLDHILEVDGENLATTGYLFAGPSGLWSVGPEDIIRFDGDEWDIIEQSW